MPHDAAEPVQYIFKHIPSGRKLGVLTDGGHISSFVKQAYHGVNGLLLEFNYDESMLQNGPYPQYLKKRISGKQGHLSNIQSMEMLNHLDTKSLECLIAGHISEKNNSPEIVSHLLQPYADKFKQVLACQNNGFEWISI